MGLGRRHGSRFAFRVFEFDFDFDFFRVFFFAFSAFFFEFEFDFFRFFRFFDFFFGDGRRARLRKRGRR